MKKILTFAFCFALLLATAFVVQADGPGFHRRMGSMHGGMSRHGDMASHADHLAKALDLTDEQKAAARKLHEDAAAQAEPLREQVHQQWKEIHEMLEGGNADATAVGQRVIAAHAVREQLGAIHEETMTRFSALLNADQLEKLKKIKESHRDHEGFGFRERRHGS